MTFYKIPAASSSSLPCTFTLYSIDKRVSETSPVEHGELYVSNKFPKFYGNEYDKVAARINDAICSYFRVSDSWDKKLFQSMFSENLSFNWFEIERSSADLVHGIYMSGNTDIVLSGKTVCWDEDVEAPIKSDQEIRVSARKKKEYHSYHLSYDDILENYRDDAAIVSLFNCNSFRKYCELSVSLNVLRTLEKIDPKEIKQSRL
jgi:hypothetical protein